MGKRKQTGGSTQRKKIYGWHIHTAVFGVLCSGNSQSPVSSERRIRGFHSVKSPAERYRLLLYNQKNVASKRHWEKHTLCFTKKEMSAFLGRIKLRNSDRADSHFTLLRHDGTIWEGRGRPKEERKEIKGRLLKDRIDKMKRELG